MDLCKNTARRGVGLVEVVVALAIIMIVSAAAVGLLLQATEAQRKVAGTMERSEHVENIVECYRWASSGSVAYAEEFAEAMAALSYVEDAEGSFLFVKEESGYNVRVQAYVTEKSEHLHILNGIEIKVYTVDENGDVEEVLYGVTYGTTQNTNENSQ